MNKLSFIIAAFLLSSCASVPPIQLASESKSPFANAVFGGETVILDQPMKNSEASYRIFRQAATGFVSLSTVRANAEQASIAFCERKNETMHGLSETAAKPPYILGNFPRIELVFECVEKTENRNHHLAATKYEKLTVLKKLLDDGVLTKQEFEQEKAKVLAEN
ncbi:SHOCT domain-containing protein [Acinetobacter sp. SM34]|uniref:SHOCT domain-containing protein n=1 Tax=Acinetobacter sp. SM34 TaxID=1301620 RepID=UPI001EDA3E08|nr:SHOCT domain-containing protein [Acinetobacter sp. SM34]MCG2608600.1 SHOCT domain-containing protein [Acinetobacter sp. SM34]